MSVLAIFAAAFAYVERILVPKTMGAPYGPQLPFTQADLENYLQAVDAINADSQKLTLQSEVDATVNLFVTIHAALVLVQATTRKFQLQYDLPEETIMLAAFNPVEVGDDGQGGLVGESKTIIETISSGNQGISLRGDPNEPGLFQYIADELQLYLERLSELPTGFRVESYLDTCRETADHQELRGRYLLTALALVRSVLGEGDLDQARAWLGDTLNPINMTPEWLKIKLHIDDLNKQVKELYSGSPDHDETKLALSRIVAMLDTNRKLYGYIRDRLGLLSSEGIAEFPNTVLDEQKDAWHKITLAMYGVIAWRIVQHVRIAVSEAQNALALASRP